jgi:hypothetical protein
MPRLDDSLDGCRYQQQRDAPRCVDLPALQLRILPTGFSLGAMPDRPSQDSLALLRQALAHHKASRLPEAESLYRQLLNHEPDHPEALRLMGVLARQRGPVDNMSWRWC